MLLDDNERTVQDLEIDGLDMKRESTHPSTKSLDLVRCGLCFFVFFMNIFLPRC